MADELILTEKLFNVSSAEKFNDTALEIFQFQYGNNLLYKRFVDLLIPDPFSIKTYSEIPFLPIEFFKNKKILTKEQKADLVFTSSGTTGGLPSKHYVADRSVYRKSFQKTFELFYGEISDYCLLALLPSYLEREGSSLVYMVSELIKNTRNPDSGFYLKDYDKLTHKIIKLNRSGKKILLFGVSFALLELAEKFKPDLPPNTIVMETGGMKGRKEEITRKELHSILIKSFGVNAIHSEYGMTELLSQAYSKGQGKFYTPPWMKVIIRDINDPLSIESTGRSGGINVIDLANIYSCSFIATQDIGKVNTDGSFEVLGRYDYSDIRGCNLMIT